MQIVIGGHSDIGPSRLTNQDSLFIRVAECAGMPVCVGVVCDGVGGLQDGEMASVVSTLFIRQWFERVLQEQYKSIEPLKQGLLDCMHQINKRIAGYSKEHNVRTGTTVSVILIFGEQFFIAHIGDSRIYKVDNAIYQLTVDHATTRPRQRDGAVFIKKLLTQCVGFRDELSIFICDGWARRNEAYLLCSDGFYEKMQEKEVIVCVKKIRTKSNVDEMARDMIDRVIKRNGSDNVSLGIIKFI